ncbi:MAG: YceI family protein [Rhodocyclaceae bacterium]|nr:YceI family protein [Rhodocyclaceae bacterium]
MKKYFAACALSLVLAAPAFSADTYTMDPEYTIPTFEVQHLGFTTQRGRFDKSEGKVMLDFAAKKGMVEFTVFTNSLDMGSQAWTIHVSSPGLFNVEQYPTMTFKSHDLVFEGNKVVAANGQFTLLGVTKPLTVTVDHFTCGTNPTNKKPMCAGNITATIKRSDFGMTKYIPTVSDEIKINVPVEAYKD